MKSAISSHRSRRRRAASAAIAVAVTAALGAVAPRDVSAASDQRAGVPDLADRVVALRELLAQPRPSAEGVEQRLDSILTPDTRLSQWKKWQNG